MNLEYSKYLSQIGSIIPCVSKENECKEFWEILSSKIEGLKINYADNRIWNISASLNAQDQLEDLKEILLFIEKIFKETNRTNCQTKDIDLVNRLSGVVKFSEISDLSNPQTTYIVADISEKALEKKYKRLDFFDNKKEYSIIINNISNNIQVEKNNGNIANNVTDGNQNIVNNELDKIVELIKENKKSLIEEGLSESELDDFIKEPQKSKAQKIIENIKNIPGKACKYLSLIESIAKLIGK